jgi:hypothetical protein
MIEDKLVLVALANTYKTYRSSRWLSATMNYVLIYKIFQEHFEYNIAKNALASSFNFPHMCIQWLIFLTNILSQI